MLSESILVGAGECLAEEDGLAGNSSVEPQEILCMGVMPGGVAIIITRE